MSSLWYNVIIMWAVSLVMVGILVVFFFLITYFLMRRFLSVPTDDLQVGFEIIDVGPDWIKLPKSATNKQISNTAVRGHYALVWDGGYAWTNHILAEDDNTVTRNFLLQEGSMPSSGTPARMHWFMFPDTATPMSAHGVDFQAVTLQSDVPLKGWWLPNEKSTAILFIHGKKQGGKVEMLRFLPSLVKNKFPILAIAYRNHDDSGRSADGWLHYGASEWRDIVVALQFLKEQNIKKVVIFSISMGASATLEMFNKYLHSQEVADDVINMISGLILESPVVNVRDTVAHTTSQVVAFPRTVIQWLSRYTLWVSKLRTGVDFLSLNHLKNAPHLHIPLLIIHGHNDSIVPMSTSDMFFDAYGGHNKTYMRVRDGQHADAWNSDRQRYERELIQFLRYVEEGLSGLND